MNKKPQLLIKKSLLQAIKNSIGSNIFRSVFIKDNGSQIDVMEDGIKSCAFFVSGILSMFGLIDRAHSTVKTTEEKLLEYNWQKVDVINPQPCDVIIWEEIEFEDGSRHKHIGFYVGGNKAISNDIDKRTPQSHDWIFNGKRQIESLLRYSFSK
jgi:hypothetical protein